MNMLKEISVRKLELDRNEGFYFKGSVLQEPWKAPGSWDPINVLLKDKDGDIARAVFYNMKDKKDSNRLDKMFSGAREVIILNPLYTVALDGLPLFG